MPTPTRATLYSRAQIASRSFAGTTLESSMPRGKWARSSTTAAATTGPASGAQLAPSPRRRNDRVHNLPPLAVPALGQEVTAVGENRFLPAKRLELRDVRRDHRGNPHQPPERRDRRCVGELRPARRDHHRIEDD